MSLGDDAAASLPGEADDSMFDTNDYTGAMRVYLHALTDLAPWYASPLLFTVQQINDLGLAAL